MLTFESSERFSSRLKIQWLAGLIVESHRQSNKIMLGGKKFAWARRERMLHRKDGHLQVRREKL